MSELCKLKLVVLCIPCSKKALFAAGHISFGLVFFFSFFSLKGKIFSMSDNPSLDSVDSEYEMGSVQRDLNFLEDNPSLKDIMLANQPSPRMTSPFISLRPANPAMQALSSQKREAHNRSPVSFREGRRASDTSLTQGDWGS